MANTTEQQVHLPLGVGEIFGESFGILFKNFIPVVLLSFATMLVSVLVSAGITSPSVALGLETPNFDAAGGWVTFFVSFFLQMAFYGLATAFLVQLAYDAKLGRTIMIGRYVGPALKAAFPIAILAIVSFVLMGIGLVFLIIPGVWLYAVFSVVAPAVVIEGIGAGALKRSAQLTKNYRWPIVGTLILIGICTGVINSFGGFVIGLTSGGEPSLFMLVLLALVTSLGAGLTGISVALIYARLREIKEGVTVDQIASVFD